MLVVPSTVVAPLKTDPILPIRGYFDLSEIFNGTSYDAYNSYSRSMILAKAQEKLKTAGLYRSTVDGSMGPGTQQAIIVWQRQQGLAVTGMLNHETQLSMSLGGQLEKSQPHARPKITSNTSSPSARSAAPTSAPTPAPARSSNNEALNERIRSLQQTRDQLKRRQEELKREYEGL